MLLNLSIILFVILLFKLFRPIEKFNPFLGLSTRRTRNMSYDLRGEAFFPPIKNYIFNNSELSFFI